MNTLRRSSLRAKLRLESLEDRITPVVGNPVSGHMAAMTGAILAHTNVIIQSEAPMPTSDPSVATTFKRHHHKLHRSRITPMPDSSVTASGISIPIVYRLPVLSPPSGTPKGPVATPPDPSVGI